MEENNYFEENADEIVGRFEQYLKGSDTGYFDVEELETIADYYLRRGRTKESNRAIDVGLRLHPASSALQLKRARTLLASGDIHKAIQTLKSLPNPNAYEVQLLLLDAYTRIHQTEATDLVIEKLLQLEGEADDNVTLDIALILMSQEEFAKASLLLEEELRRNPKNSDVLFELAFCYEQMDKVAESVVIYNKIIDQNPYVSEAWFNLGQIYFRLQRYQEAIEAYDFCLAIEPNDSLVWLQKGHLLAQIEKFGEAIQCFINYLDEQPDNWQIECYIADCYEKNGDYDKAIEYYDKALELFPVSYEALTGKSVCMLEKEQFQEAIPLLEQALEISPDSYEVWVFLAEAYSNLEHMEQANNAYKKALEMEPNQPETWVAAGNLLLDMSSYQEALTHYLKAFQLDSELEHIHILLAIAYAKLKEFEPMFQFLDMAVKQNPKNIDIFMEVCPEVSEILTSLFESYRGKLEEGTLDGTETEANEHPKK